MEKQLKNPYKMNWQLYLLIMIGALCFMVVGLALPKECVITEIIKNLAYGSVASTLVAIFIQIGNIKEKNLKANSVYEAVYSDLRYYIANFIE